MSSKAGCIPYHEKLGVLVRKAYVRVVAAVERHLKPTHLSMREYSVLCTSGNSRRPVSRKRLVSLMGVRMDDILGLCAVLVERGLITVDANGRVLPTASGRALLADATPLVLAAHDELRQGFSDMEWQHGLDFIMALGTSLIDRV
jgi:hypothetical protein